MLKCLLILCFVLFVFIVCSNDSNSLVLIVFVFLFIVSVFVQVLVVVSMVVVVIISVVLVLMVVMLVIVIIMVVVVVFVDVFVFVEDLKWVEGKNYFCIELVQLKVFNIDKVEVVEVFFYVCFLCNVFYLMVDQLVKILLLYVVMVYLLVLFMLQENFLMFQCVFFIVQVLGVVDKVNDVMYDVVWKSKELSFECVDGQGLKLMFDLFKFEDVVKVYVKFGVDLKEFVVVVNFFSINIQVKCVDQLVKVYGVEGMLIIVIDGKYCIDLCVVGGYVQMVEFVKYFVVKEVVGK